MIIDSIEDITEVFTYHAPNEEQKIRYENVRAFAKQFGLVILSNVPSSADRSAAFRHLRECVMTANAAIALDGKY
jgi:hypothetical protein